jgi:VWFA-related protein
MPLRRSIVLVSLAVGLPLALAAQTPDSAPPQPSEQVMGQPGITTLKLSTRIVVLDVVVTDKKGNLVLDRTRDDFTIVEDKVPQTIRSFEPPSAHVMPPNVVVNNAQDLKKIGDAPVTILVLDELNTRFEDMVYVRNAMTKYLDAQPAVLKQPTVLLLATNTRFVQMHDYTQDRDALINEIKHRMPEYPYKMMAGKGGPAAVERMAQGLASLEQIAQASTGTPGRKNVIWVGNGFPSADLSGLDDKTSATIQAAIKQCTDMLLAARITMYTINPTMNSTVTLDVETPEDLDAAETDTGGDPFAGVVQFSNFAPSTGGRAFLSRNDINNEIAEGIAAGSNYYTLSYAPTNRTDDAAKYRNIRIVMKDPNLRATTRDGYYPPTAAATNPTVGEAPKQAKAQLELDISSAVNSAISYNGLTLAAAKAASGNYAITVKAAGLDWTAIDANTERTEATVMAAWYSDKGKLLGHSGKELTANRPASTNAANPPDVTFTLPVALPSGVARVRFIVRDAVNGHMGTVDITKP